VARDRRARGDFERWRAENPRFNPYALELVQAKHHVLEFALRGLSQPELQVLQTIAAFRMPTQYEVLLAVCSGAGKPCADSAVLDAVLTQLEDRGLLGWDRRSDRYDLHPVVRGVSWTLAGDAERAQAYQALHGYFDAAPKVDDYLKVNTYEDLTPAIELYHTLVGMGKYEEACDLFYEKISDATLWRLGSNRQRVELLEKLFPDGLDQQPRLSKDGGKAYTFNALALAYQYSGEPGKSVYFFEKQIEIREKQDVKKSVAIGLSNLSDALRSSGRLREAAEVARRSVDICREIKDEFQEAVGLYWLGLAQSAAGLEQEGKQHLERSREIWIQQKHVQFEGVVHAFLAQHHLWHSQPAEALRCADRAWELAHHLNYESDFICAACRQGQAALALGDLGTAQERLHHALARARAINYVQEELPALIALAELARQQGKPQEARALLSDVWEYAERGPYPLEHADAFNVLCQIERDAGHTEAAREAAEQAYRMAWCDGPPWAYHYGLEQAKQHLRALGVAEPKPGSSSA
jgi:tetratricopeptide (TPR) repeat protein